LCKRKNQTALQLPANSTAHRRRNVFFCKGNAARLHSGHSCAGLLRTRAYFARLACNARKCSAISRITDRSSVGVDRHLSACTTTTRKSRASAAESATYAQPRSHGPELMYINILLPDAEHTPQQQAAEWQDLFRTSHPANGLRYQQIGTGLRQYKLSYRICAQC